MDPHRLLPPAPCRVVAARGLVPRLGHVSPRLDHKDPQSKIPAPLTPRTTEPCMVLPSLGTPRLDRHPQRSEPHARVHTEASEEEVEQVLRELEEIQSSLAKQVKPAVVRLGALVDGAHPTVPKAASLSAAEKFDLWTARRIPDCAMEDVVPPPHPDWDAIVPYSILGPTSPRVGEGDGELEHRRSAGREGSGGESDADLQSVLARLVSLEQKLEDERDGTNAMVQKYDRLILESDEAHAREVAALREMIDVAQSQRRQGASTASRSTSARSFPTSSSSSRS